VGKITWIGPVLASTFALYGFVRKGTQVAALDGLLVETGLMMPFALALIGWWTAHGSNTFPSGRVTHDVLTVLAGPVTAAPLALFAAGARRIRLTTMAFVQFLSPTITLVLAVFAFGEPFSTTDMLCFAFVWAALAMVAWEGRTFGAMMRGRSAA
jgi:chloramphenicol-sensitive protein RarD